MAFWRPKLNKCSCMNRRFFDVSDFYIDMASMVSGLLSPTSQGGLGQGSLAIISITPGEIDDDVPWMPVETTEATVALKGVVRGVDRELIGTEAGGIIIQASDRVVFCAVPETLPQAGESCTIDGVATNILSVSYIPAAGIPAAMRLIVRG